MADLKNVYKEDTHMKKLASILMALALCGCGSQEIESIRLSCDQKDLEVDETIKIKVQVEPESIELSEDSFHATKDPDLDWDGEVLRFTADEAGDYQITASQDGVSSNTLILSVKEDPKTSKEKEEADDEKTSKEPEEQKTEEESEVQNQPASSEETEEEYTVSWSQSDPLQVDEVWEYGNLLVNTDQDVWIRGQLPQTIRDEEEGMILWNEDQSMMVQIEDPDHLIQQGNQSVTLVGPISKTDSGYKITVKRVY